MAADDKSDMDPAAARRADPADPKPASSARPPRRAPVRAGEGQVGQTLRTVYQQTVNEDIPAEMLDLLGKLA